MIRMLSIMAGAALSQHARQLLCAQVMTHIQALIDLHASAFSASPQDSESEATKKPPDPTSEPTAELPEEPPEPPGTPPTRGADPAARQQEASELEASGRLENGGAEPGGGVSQEIMVDAAQHEDRCDQGLTSRLLVMQAGVSQP